ncbi:DUF2975 domain-containing protein [Shewanella gaetbuli]|uniref:DUF2975 domain-containing protein n=1 Tax=Shewanella gaetbuli TaxID=220752 RepID=A0A9X2CLI8_9GAMM|nr:DUF2975 domain-containing protein [Shewanella gaetbuli]MCL1142789.1 DUF2975 domain-containing protein [Shewanella gaetbuli]
MNRKQLSQLCGYLRWASILTAMLVLGYWGYYYFAHNEIRFVQQALFSDLWNHPNTNNTALWFIISPSIICMLLLTFWLQKLLGIFQSGHFFSKDSLNCYLWLVWTNAASIILGVMTDYAIKTYHKDFFATGDHIEILIDFSNILTMLLLLLIAHLLKTAKDVEDENKEFI